VSINEAVSKIRGEAGTSVTLTLQRGGSTDKPFDLVIKRGTITVSSVSWKDKGDGTAYIRISRFGPDTNDEWSKTVSEINSKMAELDAIIVDVRGNPGGYLQSAVYVAGEFFSRKVAVYQELATGEQIPLETDRVGAFTKIPAVYVLIDGGSASASEILAGALKDQIKAKLVGTKSFGKGTIQDARDFKDGSGVHITVAKWLTPNKVWVHKKGIDPDVAVEGSYEDFAKGIDNALDKAVELAKQI
jgi:carboxyl-terminal processing protease